MCMIGQRASPLLQNPACLSVPPAPTNTRRPTQSAGPGAVSSGHARQRGRLWEPEPGCLSTVGMGQEHGWPLDLAPACSRAASMTCICLLHVWLRIYFIIWRKAFTANKRAN